MCRRMPIAFAKSPTALARMPGLASRPMGDSISARRRRWRTSSRTSASTGSKIPFPRARDRLREARGAHGNTAGGWEQRSTRAKRSSECIRAGHIRTIRPDLARLGGITPFLKIAAVAEAFQVAVSPVRMPEVGIHLACGLGVVAHVDVVSWFKDVFSGGPDHRKRPAVATGGTGIGTEGE